MTRSETPAAGWNLAPTSVHQLNGAAEQEWDACVARSSAGTFCHLLAWKRLVEDAWGHQGHYVYAERAGSVVGVLPLFLVDTGLFGRRLVSTPNAVYGGAAAEDAIARDALLAVAKRLGRDLGVEYLELRDWHESQSSPDTDLLTDDLYVSFDHPITTDEDRLLQSFPRDNRRMIRLGLKHGLVSETGREELLQDFYDAYATSVRNLGTPVFPRRLFEQCLRQFCGACDILVVRQGHRVAAAVLSFYYRDTVFPYYAGAYPEFYRAGVNNFMYWELMRQGAARGLTRFDFGRSKRGTGAYAFKHGWGMREQPMRYRYCLGRAKTLPKLNPTNPKFDRLIRLWKRLPVPVTKWVGPLIARSLP